MKKCVIIGCGEHSRVLLESIKRLNDASLRVDCFVDMKKELWGRNIRGIRVLGGDDKLIEVKNNGVDYFIVGVGGTGDCSLRKRLFEEGLKNDLKPLTLVDPTAIVAEDVVIEEGAQILAGVIINCGAQIGKNTIINSGAIVEHDCVIGNHVHVAPGVTLSGSVIIGDESHIGTGASVIQGIKIGKKVIVGAGAVVIRDVEDLSVVAGVPAKILRKRME